MKRPASERAEPLAGETRGAAPNAEQPAEDLPLFERAGQPLWGRPAEVAEALVIDDGELDDVIGVLEELGARLARPRFEGPADLASWTPPERVLVVSARSALALQLPLRIDEPEFVAIAVTDSDARTVGASVQRLGYRYVVRRPVHPLALRALLREALWPQAGRRRVSREASGAEVSWRVGWWRRRAALIDVSARGCQLLALHSAPLRARVQIRMPAEGARRSGFGLRGRVVRRAQLAGGRMVLGIEFEPHSERIQRRLEALVALREQGPAQLGAPPFAALADAARPAADAAERRRKPRVELRREVLALACHSSDVLHTLVGRDLSMDGVRVEAHPSLVLGERMRLVLFDNPGGDPITLHGEVARDDGPRGWWLRFAALDNQARSRVAQAIQSLASIESLESPEPQATWMVLGALEIDRGGG